LGAKVRVLISFGSQGYERGLAELGGSAAQFFDRVCLFRPSDIDPQFSSENMRLLSCRRGYGYWVWKPYFLLKLLRDVADGDTVFYCDALMRFIDSPEPLFPLCRANGGVMLFHQRGEGHRNATYTKIDCFKLMNAVSEEYFGGDHLNAAFQVYAKTPLAFAFLEELLLWCKNFDAVSDSPSSLGTEAPEFVAHRHDQSILSILAIKHRLRTFKDISQWGRSVTADPEYGQIVHHHRTL